MASMIRPVGQVESNARTIYGTELTLIMMMSQENLIASNDQVLAYYGTRLTTTDLNTYIAYADKLRTWLISERAYYPAARPKILETLEVARSSLCKVLGIDNEQPIPILHGQSIIVPWIVAYGRLIETVVPHFSLFTEPDAQGRLRKLLLKPPAEILHAAAPTSIPMELPAQSVTNSESSALIVHTQSSENTSEPAIGAPSSTQIDHFKPAQIATVNSYAAHPPLQSTNVTPSPVGQTSSGPSPGPMKVRPRLKTKKKNQSLEDPSFYVMADLEWLQNKEKSAPPTGADAAADASPSRPERVETVSASSAPLERECGEMASPPAAPQPELDKTALPSSAPLSELNSGEVISSPTPTHKPNGGETATPVDSSTSHIDLTISSPIPEPARDAPYSPTNLELGKGAGNSSALPPYAQYQTVKPAPGSQPSLSDPSLVSSSVHSAVKPSSAVSPPPSAYKPSPFGPGTLRLAAHQGSASQDPIVFSFDVNDEMYARVLRWNGRYKASDNNDDFLCLSLVCYPTTMVATFLEDGSEEASLLETISSVPCIWPKQNGLFLNANFEGSRWNFPLAPPFAVTPDNFMDITVFVEPGANVQYLRQYLDMTGYTFILLAHTPTEAQMAELRKRRQADLDWAVWLKEVPKTMFS